MRILVTGASGLLGLNLCLHLADEHKIFGTFHSRELKKPPFPTVYCDMQKRQSIEAAIDKIKPEFLINCAAMANVDSCELQPDMAQLINAEMPGTLAVICKKRGIKLIHISTDAVFDGKMGDYTEEDSPNPLSVYARTKLDGEQAVSAEDPQAIIARVNFYGFSLDGKRSLAEFFLSNLVGNNQVNGFVDVMFCPLYVTDLVDTLVKMIEKELSGLFHAVSPESLSKYAFGVRIAEKFGFKKDLIQPKSITEGGLLAARSPRLTLNIDKLKASEITTPDQTECMEHFHKHYLENLPEQIKALSR
jgi:dTDP-4-dehydrorhamnose reductase